MTDRRALEAKLYRRLSAWAPIIALGMIVTGAALGGTVGRGAFMRQSIPYLLGDRGPSVAEVRANLPAALHSDGWLIAGYGLILAGCALFYRARASSRLGCHVANFVGAAVAIAVVAGAIEGCLLSATLSQPDTALLRTATAAVATVMFCALAVGAVGMLASISILSRRVMGAYHRAWAWRHSRGVSLRQTMRPRKVLRWLGVGDGDQPQRNRWWQDVLADEDLPKPKETYDAVKQAMKESGQSPDAVIENQQSWRCAYNVPGVTQQLEGRGTQPLRALCLSGGGVRSSCVALGAMQVFSNPISECGSGAPMLDGLDYVISVSGGGYAAGARLLGVQAQQVDPKKKRVEKPPQKVKANVAPLAARFEEGSAEFDHVRRGSSYIADSPLGLVRALGEVLKNLVASMATIFTVPVLLGSVLGWLLALIPIAAFPPVSADHPTTDRPLSLVAHPAALWALGFFAAWAVLFTMAAVVIEWKSDGPRSECVRMRISGLARGSAGFALVVFVLTMALPGLMWLCAWAGSHTTSVGGSAFGALSGVVGLNYVAALVAMIWRDKNKLALTAGTQSSASMLKRVLPPGVISLLLIVATLAVLLAVWLALLGGFAAGFFHLTTQSGQGFAGVLHKAWWVIGVALIVAFLGFADVTSLSLHPFYRRRLARTFAVRRQPDQGKPNTAVRYPANEPTWLHLYGHITRACSSGVTPGDAPGCRTEGPKFVFACSATITGPGKPAPGLNAVSYVLSADYIGGPALGWFHTEQLLGAAPPRIRRDLTVEAAVAVSGAAFASAMGRQDKGIEKLLAVSGARLGTWLPNPNFVRQLRDAENGHNSYVGHLPRVWPKSLPSVRGAGYLYREILGINNQDARLVQITDGGHYDNSGLVEALRRRCGVIVVIDGGGDPPPLPLGLTDALRLAKYELGVDITMKRTGPYSVVNIAPGSGTQFAKDNALSTLNSRITRGAVVTGDITYPAAAGLKVSTGKLIFVKAVVSQACPYWLLTYAAASDIFPHDPTSDQWFNEGQFAAYTELGRVIAKEAVECLRYLKLTDAAESSEQESRAGLADGDPTETTARGGAENAAAAESDGLPFGSGHGSGRGSTR